MIRDEKPHTHWPAVLIVVGAGIASAFQVGKASVALSTVQSDLAMSLAVASWLLSAFAIVGALAGVPIGLVADRIGARRMVVGGLLLQGICSAIGALADGPALLLSSRALEGLGFLAVVVGAPTLLSQMVAERDRKRAFALWATFMPAGFSLALLSVALLAALGWRGFWLMNAALLCACAVLVVLSVSGRTEPSRRRTIAADVRAAAMTGGPWLLAGLFACFSAIFFAVFGFLPTILADRLGVSGASASLLSAAAVIASAAGNLICGWALSRGAAPWRVLIVAFGLLATGGGALFAGDLPGAAAYALCVAFSCVSGFIPVVLIEAAPRHAPRPDLIGAVMGFVMQGNNLGLLVGPAATGIIAGSVGWPSLAWLIIALALMASLMTVLLRGRPIERMA